jgi:hypothetical protein
MMASKRVSAVLDAGASILATTPQASKVAISRKPERISLPRKPKRRFRMGARRLGRLGALRVGRVVVIATPSVLSLIFVSLTPASPIRQILNRSDIKP